MFCKSLKSQVNAEVNECSFMMGMALFWSTLLSTWILIILLAMSPLLPRGVIYAFHNFHATRNSSACVGSVMSFEAVIIFILFYFFYAQNPTCWNLVVGIIFLNVFFWIHCLGTFSFFIDTYESLVVPFILVLLE